ncbi:MAG: diaminopimelate decarboxylase [Clostridia bacterium]|nr:diaminopimelate decarboxylase [Clostridia bacterium]MBQ7316412.1 diaminopimelate decarboxylase [Clostridia bacterium]
MICSNLSVNPQGHLCINGADTVALAKQYGTPLYIMDEDRIRENCRTYLTAMKEAFGDTACPLYASKAASFRQIYRIMKEEGMGVDVVSSGEVYTAHSVGFPMEKAYFHSNNKTDADISYAMDCGIGYFVADNYEELDAVERIAAEKGLRQKVLLRLTPGIDPHTYAAVATGKVDSKFGSAIETGQAEAITAYALRLSHVELMGFHCHVGSQVFDSDVFLRASEIMLEFIAHIKAVYGYTAPELDLGGGYGVRYLASHPEIDIAANIREVAAAMKEKCAALGLELPAVRMEPGRSIVADAGLTVYTAGTVKRIPGYKNYVSVDGGMTDNPRFALYGSPYTVLLANRASEDYEKDGETFTCSVVGRCCESGDILQENVILPANVTRGDLVAVLTTGAYNYAMSSNYNRIPKPPVVMVKDGESYVAVKRETPEDVCRNDL